MKREKIKEKLRKIEKRLEMIGPVSKTLMKEAASELNFLKNEEIDIKNEKEFKIFIEKLNDKLSRIVGKEISKTLIQIE